LDEYGHALAKLSLAICELAIGPGDVRSRLLAAALALGGLMPKDFPEHLRPDFEWVEKMLTRAGPIPITLAKMQNRTGRQDRRADSPAGGPAPGVGRGPRAITENNH